MSTKAPLPLKTVVSSGLLRANSLLYLEMGRPPVPGMIELEISIDTTQMGE